MGGSGPLAHWGRSVPFRGSNAVACTAVHEAQGSRVGTCSLAGAWAVQATVQAPSAPLLGFPDFRKADSLTKGAFS